VLVDVMPGPWFYRTLSVPPGGGTSLGVTIQSIVNSTGAVTIEMVDPLTRRVPDIHAGLSVAACPTTQLYCDFDLVNVMPGTYQAVVWPGTPRREDAQLSISQVFDQVTTQRDTGFVLSAGQNGRLNFTAQSGESLKLVMTRQTSTYPATDVWFYLLDALGNRLSYGALSYSVNTTTWNLPTITAAGNYSIVFDTQYGTPVSMLAKLLPQ
jgi:hypothetical protein